MSRAMINKVLLFHKSQKAFLLMLSKSGSCTFRQSCSFELSSMFNLMRIVQGAWQGISQWPFLFLQAL